MRVARSSGLALILVLLGSSLANAGDPGEHPAPRPLAGVLTLGVGGEYSSGDYGQDTETEFWFVPFSLRYEFDDLTITPYRYDSVSFKLTIPIVRIDGSDNVLAGGTGPVPARGHGSGTGAGSGAGRESTTTDVIQRDETGLGDVLLTVAYHLFPPVESRLPWLTISGKVKAPTASESKDLGTGEADYTLFASLYQRFGRFGLHAGGGYQFMGDSQDLDLDDRALASLGVDADVSPQVRVGLDYDYGQAVNESVSDSHEFMPWVSIDVGDQLRVEPYGVFGASDGSPDYGVGIRLSWSLKIGSPRREPSGESRPPDR